MSEIVLSQWYNDVYKILTQTLPGKNITTNISSQSFSSNEVITVSKYNKFLNDLNSLKNNKFLKYASVTLDNYSQVSSGDIVTKNQLKKETVDKYLNEIKNFCGNTSYTQRPINSTTGCGQQYCDKGTPGTTTDYDTKVEPTFSACKTTCGACPTKGFYTNSCGDAGNGLATTVNTTCNNCGETNFDTCGDCGKVTGCFETVKGFYVTNEETLSK